MAFAWELPCARDEWSDQVRTFDGHSHISVEKLGELPAGTGAVTEAPGASFTMGYCSLGGLDGQPLEARRDR